MQASEIAKHIEAAWITYLEKQRRAPIPHPYVYASGHRACLRRMVYEMTQPEQAPPFEAEVLAKFRRGEDRERDLLADLTRIGRDAQPSFSVVNQQERFQLRDHKGRVAIVGKVDARLELNGVKAPIEVKAWSPQLIAKIETFTDLFDNPWTRSGSYQLLAYLYGAAEPYGFLLLDRSGLPKLLPVELDTHLDRVEDFLMKAERALDHRDAGTLPDYTTDAAECRRCNFYGGVCNPPLSSPGAQVLTDPELEAALERREALREASHEYDALDKDVKGRLRGIETGICGHFAIQGKWGKTTGIELPPDLKAKYTVSDPKGKFTLEITRT